MNKLSFWVAVNGTECTSLPPLDNMEFSEKHQNFLVHEQFVFFWQNAHSRRRNKRFFIDWKR